MARFFLALFVLASPATAQDRGLAPLVRGIFQEWLGSEGSGTFLFHTQDKQEYRCLYSNKTYFENDHKRTYITAIEPGTQLEILSEKIAEPPRCRALIVRVVFDIVQPAGAGQIRPKSTPGATESFAPRGNLLFSGVILRVYDVTLVLRTRDGQRYTIHLRPDTSFTTAAGSLEKNEVPLNRPVQIRAGRTFENEIEAYSLVWGDILKP